MYNQASLRRLGKEKDLYNKFLETTKYFSPYWVKLQCAIDAQIFEDETVNSVKSLRSHSKRSGKFNQYTFIVCYNFKLNYGYYFNTHEHFKFLKPNQIETFYRLVSERDINFRTIWFKDARRYGSTDRVSNMISTSKANTSKIERLFSKKIKVYSKFKNGMIKTQTDLNSTYESLLNELNLREIRIG
jgi:hypothetical protein